MVDYYIIDSFEKPLGFKFRALASNEERAIEIFLKAFPLRKYYSHFAMLEEASDETHASN